MSTPCRPDRPEDLPPSARQLEQAARWFVVLASGDASDDQRRRWQAWRMAHPANEQAWLRATGSAACFAQIPPDQALASLRALSQADAPKSTARRKGLAQLAVLLIGAMAGWQGYRGSDWSADLVTGVGELRETTLADGSRVLLDTDSAADVDFSARTRLIRLRRGRIMIATAPDRAANPRPLMVATAEGRVLAQGTRFSVYQEAATTRVTVLEARVALSGHDSRGDATLLGAGQTARFDRRGRVDQRAAPLADSAWVQGMLLANDQRLGDLLGELARYRPEPLSCDSAAAELRVSGAFPLRDSERALAALAETLPIEIDRRATAGGPLGLVVRRK